MFYREFFEIFSKHYCKTLLGNCFWMLTSGKYNRHCWSKISLFSPLRSFSFWVIAFDGPSHATKEFICKLFNEALRNSLKFSEICALLSIWYCYLHNFFKCSFHLNFIVEELMVEVNSFDVRRSSLIIFLFLFNHEERYWLEIRNFHIEILFVQLILDPCYS